MVDFEKLHSVIEMLEEKRVNQLIDKVNNDEEIDYKEMIMLKDYYDTHKPEEVEE